MVASLGGQRPHPVSYWNEPRGSRKEEEGCLDKIKSRRSPRLSKPATHSHKTALLGFMLTFSMVCSSLLTQPDFAECHTDYKVSATRDTSVRNEHWGVGIGVGSQRSQSRSMGPVLLYFRRESQMMLFSSQPAGAAWFIRGAHVSGRVQLL